MLILTRLRSGVVIMPAVVLALAAALTVTAEGTAAADGAAFTIVPSPALPAGSMLRGITTFGENDAWVVGSTPTGSNNQSEPLIEHWDGSSWQIQATPDIPGGSLRSVSAVAGNDVWAVGTQTYPQTPGVLNYYGNPALLLHWDGNQWTRYGEPFGLARTDVIMNGVKAISAHDVWAVGQTYYNGYGGAIAMHWDGTAWTASGLSSNGIFPGQLAAVDATATDDVWTTGAGSDSAGNPELLLEHWDGTAWSTQPGPASSLSIGDAVTTDTYGDTWVAGESGPSPFGDLPSIVGSVADGQWTNSTLPNDFVLGLAPDQQGGLWAASEIAGGAPGVQHWDGTTWTRATLPPPVGGSVAGGAVGVATSASGASTWAFVDQINNNTWSDRSELIMRAG